jgi:hypothetical protein
MCGVDLISDALPFGRFWYGEPNAISNAIGYAKFFSRVHDAVIRVYDEAGMVFLITRSVSKVCYFQIHPPGRHQSFVSLSFGVLRV